MGYSQADDDIAEGRQTGRKAALRECLAIVEGRIKGWTLTSNGLARQDEAEEIAGAIRGLLDAGQEATMAKKRQWSPSI